MSRKNLILVLLLPFLLSCNKDDDGSTISATFEKKIIGTWNLIGREPHGIEYCELSTNMQFFQEGEFSYELFIGDTPGECESASISGTWSYLGDNQIEFNPAGIEENTVLIIEFFDNDTGFRLKELDNSDEYEVYAKQ